MLLCVGLVWRSLDDVRHTSGNKKIAGLWRFQFYFRDEIFSVSPRVQLRKKRNHLDFDEVEDVLYYNHLLKRIGSKYLQPRIGDHKGEETDADFITALNECVRGYLEATRQQYRASSLLVEALKGID